MRGEWGRASLIGRKCLLAKTKRLAAQQSFDFRFTYIITPTRRRIAPTARIVRRFGYLHYPVDIIMPELDKENRPPRAMALAEKRTPKGSTPGRPKKRETQFFEVGKVGRYARTQTLVINESARLIG